LIRIASFTKEAEVEAQVEEEEVSDWGGNVFASPYSNPLDCYRQLRVLKATAGFGRRNAGV
jgi:hypothetical protein